MYRRKRIKRKRSIMRGPLPVKHVILITFLFFMGTSLISLWIVNAAIEPTLMRYAESETKKLTSLVINQAIKETLSKHNDMDKIITDIPKQGDDIAVDGIQFNTEIINRIRSETSLLIQNQLSEIENGHLSSFDYLKDRVMVKENGSKGIIHEVPLGKATNNALLGNLGPKIPVEMETISDIQSDVKTTLEPYGINNALIKVYLEVEVHAQVIIPFASKPTKITTTIPMGMRVVSGHVPTYFNGSGTGASPAIQLPAK
jgi:sporulation protein YunB